MTLELVPTALEASGVHDCRADGQAGTNGLKAPSNGLTLHRKAKLFADYIISSKSLPLAPSTRHQVTRCMFDLFIASIAGVRSSGPASTRQAAARIYPSDSVPIWWTGTASSMIGAAWCNSASAAVLDLDDGSRPARGHPGAAVIPTALAIGHSLQASMDSIIRAIVVGYEVAIGVGSARRADDFGVSITWATFGVVATAAFMLDLSADEIEHAFGIAGDHIPTHTSTLR